MLDLEHFTSLPRVIARPRLVRRTARAHAAAPSLRYVPTRGLREALLGLALARAGASAPHADALRVAAVPPRVVAAGVDRAADGCDAVAGVRVRRVAMQPVAGRNGLDGDTSGAAVAACDVAGDEV